MKKFINTALIALAGMFALSCANEKDMVTFDSSKVVNQVLYSVSGTALADVGESIEMTYDEAKFGLQAPCGYDLYVAVPGTDFDPCQKLNATIADGTITFTQKDLNTALLNLGAEADSDFEAEFRLRGYLKNDKGAAIERTAVWSNAVTATFIPYSADLLDVDVYDHVWIIGASSTVGSWSFDNVYQYLYDYTKSGNTYTGVISFNDGSKGAADGWKITGTNAWVDNLNWGSEAQAESSEQSEIQLVAGGSSKDIKCLSKNFYSLKYNTTSLVLSVVDGWDKISIVGDFQGWNPADEDCVMNYNDSYHRFYIDYTFDSDASLKFAADGAWDLNWGANCEKNGDNIDVAAGSYRIYLDLNKNEYSFSAGMYGKEEPVIGGGDEPEPEPEPYVGWGIIGIGGDWDNDVAMTEKDGVWTGYANVADGDSFKLRKDAAWTENYGGTFSSLGTAFDAVAGGDNISVPAGFYQIVFDSNNLKITISKGEVWSIIGNFNNWAGDVDMTKTEDGLWVAEEVALTDGWKLRYNHAWDSDRGGTFSAFGTAFDAVAGGDNISCGEGTFTVTYDPSNETITVESAAKCWGVIGDFNGWSTDEKMTEVAPGIWMSGVLELNENGWKVRYNGDWDENYGGETPSAQGEFVQAVAGGSDIKLGGTVKVVLNTNNGTIGTLGFGLVGTISSLGFNWAEDYPMNLGKDGKWYSIPAYFKTEDTFKIRYEAGWDVNFGGSCAAAETAFEAVAGGDNIQVPEAGTYMVVYDPSEKTLTLTKDFWGIIGDFNSWGGDIYMMNDGEGNWVAYNQSLKGGWKIRQSSAWDNDRGGTFTAAGTAIEAVKGGYNIDCSSLAKFNVVYSTKDETITVSE